MSPTREGGGGRIPLIAEMFRKMEKERRTPEQQIAGYQRGNSNQENTHCQK
jgi:hypothetical protein